MDASPYDTSLPKDTVTGAHPVKSISGTTAIKKFTVNTSTDKTKQTLVQQTVSLTDKSKTAILRKEESLLENKPGKAPYHWWYIVIAIVIIGFTVAGIFQIYSHWRKKIIGR